MAEKNEVKVKLIFSKISYDVECHRTTEIEELKEASKLREMYTKFESGVMTLKELRSHCINTSQ